MTSFKVTTGPLTNIALAIQLEPEFVNWPARLVVMGGTVYGESYGA